MTTLAPGVAPDYDGRVEDVTGELPHPVHPEPVDVRVIHAVRTESWKPRTVLSDQVAAGTIAGRLVGSQPSRESLTICPTADVYVGGPGVTTGTGFLVKSGTVLTLSTTAALYVIAAAPATVHTLTTIHEG